jgi:hypothetical protein
MKLTIIFMVIGLIISVSWVAWGFLPMLAILLTTLILGTIGFILDVMGYSLNKFTNKLLEKFSN